VKLMRKLLEKQAFSRGAGDRQVALLRRGKVRHEIVGLPRAGVAQEQSSREFTSADATTRMENAAFQIARISPTILVRSRPCPKHVRRLAPSHFPRHAPHLSRRSVPDVASRHRGLSSNCAFSNLRPTKFNSRESARANTNSYQESQVSTR
jgi:hypothetical protein